MKVIRYLKRTLFVLALLVLMVGVAAVLYTQTAQFKEQLRERLVTALDASLAGDMSLAGIEGSIWSNLTLTGLVLRYRDREVLAIPRVEVDYTLPGLVAGRLEISRVEVVDPVVRMRRDAQRRWDLMQALATEGEQEQDTTLPLAVILDRWGLRGGRVEVTLAEEGTYRLESIGLGGQFSARPAGIEATVERLAMRIEGPRVPPLELEGAVSYRDGRVEIERLRLASGRSLIHASAKVFDFDRGDMNAVVVIDRLAAADLAQWLPALPLRDDVSGEVRLSGRLDELTSRVELSAGGGQIRADLKADLLAEPPRYGGSVQLGAVDLDRLLADGRVTGIVQGTLEVHDAGAPLADLEATSELRIEGLRVQGRRLGKASAAGRMTAGTLTVSGDLAGPAGQARWHGEIQPSAMPSYKLMLALQDLDIEGLTPADGPLDSALTLKADVTGRGLTPVEMDTSMRLELEPSRVGPARLYGGRLAARIAEGQLRIEEARLDAKGASLRMRGRLGLAPDAAGALSYDLKVADLAPWLALGGSTGSGQLALQGEASGKRSALALEGRLQGRSARLEDKALGELDLSYALRGVGTQWPTGQLDARLRDLRAGVALRRVEARLSLPRAKRRRARLTVTAEQEPARTHRLDAEAEFSPGRIAGHVQRLVLALPEGEWRLARPAEIAYRDADRISVQDFVMTDRRQAVRLDGSLTLRGAQDLRVRMERLDLAALGPMLPITLAGALSGKIEVRGTASAPVVAARAEIDGFQLGGQPLQGLSARFDYGSGQARLDLRLQQDETRHLTAAGRLPLALGWARGWEARPLGDLDLRVRSRALDLGFVNAFTTGALSQVRGTLALDLELSGPLARPLPRGSVELLAGGATVESLGVQISEATLAAAIRPDAIRIRRLSARAGEGEIRGHGAIALKTYAPEELALSLRADRWPAIATRQYQAEVDVALEAGGNIRAPSLKGSITVNRARLRPDLAFLDDKPLKPRDQTIVLVPAAGAAQEPAAEPDRPAPAEAAFKALAVELTMRLGRDVRVIHKNADLELGGEVRAKKGRGEREPALVGAIEIARGWAGFQGRRFEMRRGTVAFTGGRPIDPSLDIMAEHRAADYLIQAQVEGSAKQPRLTLRSDPPLDHADILAVLLFGKPASALGRGEQGDLQRQALALSTGYAASAVAQSVSRALGIEDLGIDLSAIDVSGGRAELRRYLTPKTRVTASQDIAGQGGQEVSIEYQLSPAWEIQTSTSSDGSSGADIIYRKRY